MHIDALMSRFYDFLTVDLQRSKRTAYEKVWFIRRFLAFADKSISEITEDELRAYLQSFNRYSQSHYSNILKALKVFFRDFLKIPSVVESFRFPRQPFRPKHVASKTQLQNFYQHLSSVKERALFMMYAATGLRRSEVLKLTMEDIDFTVRMITPRSHQGETKKSWLSFYNEEADRILRDYLQDKRSSRSQRVFPMAREEEKELWKTAREATGLNITPQRLREWFCCEMALLGVSDRHIDAFCGRVPKSVLARHYTDYSPEKLKEIYDKASLNILGDTLALKMGEE